MLNQNIIIQMQDNVCHKKIMMDVCLKMAEYLFNKNMDDEAIELMKRAVNHDNSKFDEEELKDFASICQDKNELTHADKKMDENIRKIVEKHWKKNRHHPEFFGTVSNMQEIDIIEMVCDWYARSIQFQTEFLPFVETRQKTRFHFPDDMYQKILNYCNVLAESQQ